MKDYPLKGTAVSAVPAATTASVREIAASSVVSIGHDRPLDRPKSRFGPGFRSGLMVVLAFVAPMFFLPFCEDAEEVPGESGGLA